MCVFNHSPSCQSTIGDCWQDASGSRVEVRWCSSETLRSLSRLRVEVESRQARLRLSLSLDQKISTISHHSLLSLQR